MDYQIKYQPGKQDLSVAKSGFIELYSVYPGSWFMGDNRGLSKEQKKKHFRSINSVICIGEKSGVSTLNLNLSR